MKKALYFLCRCLSFLLLLSVSFQTEAGRHSKGRGILSRIRYYNPNGEITCWRVDKKGRLSEESRLYPVPLPITASSIAIPLSLTDPLTGLPRVISNDPVAEILLQGELLAREGWEISPLIPSKQCLVFAASNL
jgi:hypothetical protein